MQFIMSGEGVSRTYGNSGYTLGMSTLTIWKLHGDTRQAVVLPQPVSLDEITRQLPAGFYSTFRTFLKWDPCLGIESAS